MAYFVVQGHELNPFTGRPDNTLPGPGYGGGRPDNTLPGWRRSAAKLGRRLGQRKPPR